MSLKITHKPECVKILDEDTAIRIRKNPVEPIDGKDCTDIFQFAVKIPLYISCDEVKETIEHAPDLGGDVTIFTVSVASSEEKPFAGEWTYSDDTPLKENEKNYELWFKTVPNATLDYEVEIYNEYYVYTIFWKDDVQDEDDKAIRTLASKERLEYAINDLRETLGSPAKVTVVSFISTSDDGMKGELKVYSDEHSFTLKDFDMGELLASKESEPKDKETKITPLDKMLDDTFEDMFGKDKTFDRLMKLL